MSLEPTFGPEQQGMRPVLVISDSSFNQVTGMAMIAPITRGGGFARRAGFAVSLEDAGTRTTAVVRGDQARTLDLSARRAVFVESVPLDIEEDVVAKIVSYLGWEVSE